MKTSARPGAETSVAFDTVRDVMNNTLGETVRRRPLEDLSQVPFGLEFEIARRQLDREEEDRALMRWFLKDAWCRPDPAQEAS